jgi:hypothetical protein
MGDEPTKDGRSFDPMEPWRGVRDVYMDAWAKAMIEMVNTEAYAQASGAMLDTYLTVSAPFREAIEKAMLKTLEQLAMPSRADFVSIAERMTNIEMKLDDMDAKLDAVRALLTKPISTPHAKPKSARQAPKKTAKVKPMKRGKK